MPPSLGRPLYQLLSAQRGQLHESICKEDRQSTIVSAARGAAPGTAHTTLHHPLDDVVRSRNERLLHQPHGGIVEHPHPFVDVRVNRDDGIHGGHHTPAAIVRR